MVSRDTRESLMERDDYTCQQCGTSFEDSRPLEAAHIVARADGGDDHLDNLETLCIGCHAEKDGWEINDFDGSAKRVTRTASYCRDHGYHGSAFIGKFCSILNVDIGTGQELLDERL